VDAGADVNAHGESYGSTLWIALAQGYEKIVQILRQHRARVS